MEASCCHGYLQCPVVFKFFSHKLGVLFCFVSLKWGLGGHFWAGLPEGFVVVFLNV